DEYPPPTTTELLFIKDKALRDSIRQDIGATTRALTNNEWKAATVLAGAAREALWHGRLREPLPRCYRRRCYRGQGPPPSNRRKPWNNMKPVRRHLAAGRGTKAAASSIDGAKRRPLLPCNWRGFAPVPIASPI